MFEHNWLKADWPVASHVYAATTLRTGGVSVAPYESWNMGLHTGDNPQHVRQNRQLLALPAEPFWLDQVHGKRIVEAKNTVSAVPEADGAWTRAGATVCAVMTADCLPILLCDAAGQQVAAIHAGWRGLAAGIIENAVSQFSSAPETIMAWLGPAISVGAYEVGEEVRASFIAGNPEAEGFFQPGKSGHWWMDIYALARMRFSRLGVDKVYGGNACTFTEKEKYFSYRRDGETGRMVSVIWLEKPITFTV